MTSRTEPDELVESSPSSLDASRRSFLTAGLSGAILAGFAARTRAQATSGPQTVVPGTMGGDVLFLVNRITNGLNAEVWERAKSLGYELFLEEQLAYQSIDDSAMNTTLLAYPTLTLTSKQLYDNYVVPNQTPVVINELNTATILRGAQSKRQLFERMVEFWSDHFNVDHSDGQVQWLKTTEDREVIRVHALGNFHDLLLADARSAAMSYYLDNYRNFASAPNENYGREVMELHSLGVGNYTETDVFEVARCLTGWQYYPQNNALHGNFFFNAGQHDNGTKHVLGNTIVGNGVTDGERVMSILAAHSATAHFIARKMCRWLLAYDPPQPVVDAVAQVYLSTRGDIKSMIRRIFSRDLFRIVDARAMPKIKRPFHLVSSVLRTCEPTMTQPQRLVNELRTLGHMPFAWPTPDGYPDKSDYWGTSLLPRWNFLARIFGGSIAGISVNVGTLFSGVLKSQLAARANKILMDGHMAPEDVAAVQSYANAMPTLNDTLRRDVLALAASTPSFQLF